MQRPAPPRSEAELLERVRALAGRRLGELAHHLQVPPPARRASGKGWAGQLLELALGASAGSLPEPDFQLIGVELKTVPLRADGRPTESTYVCMVPLTGDGALEWRASTVYRKLARVLWLPIEAAREVALLERRIGAGVLWSPDTEQEAVLRADWEELMDLVELGALDQLDARLGTWLQIRPKARDASVRTAGIGPRGERIQTNPRGFYLRPELSARILARAQP